MNGILVIDKPQGYTSHDIVNVVRKKLGTKKVGHTGTLDPLATGVLVLCVGQATKLVSYLTAENKTYTATAKLGMTTTTDDITGEILTESDVNVTDKLLKDTLSKYTGNITQIPPKYSAIKVAGKKLYEYARKNQDVVIPVRHVTVYDTTLLSDVVLYTNENSHFNFSTTVSKGTYIRTLIKDIGVSLGCGATMEALRRTQVGAYTLLDAISLDEVNPDKLLKKETIVTSSNSVTFDSEILKRLSTGQRVKHVDDSLLNKEYFLLDSDGLMIGIVTYDVQNSLIRPKKMFVS